MSEYVVEVDDATFPEKVIAASGEMPVLVDCWAPWCGPCKAAGPVIEAVAREFEGRASVVKVNVDVSPLVSGMLDSVGVQGIPAFLFFEGGKAVAKVIGAGPTLEGKLTAKLEGLLSGAAGEEGDE